MPYKTQSKSRNTFYYVLLLAAVLLLMSCGKATSDGGGTVAAPPRYTTGNISKICMSHPRMALAMLDTAEHHRYMSNIDVMALRSVIYNNVMQEYAKAASCAEKALDDADITNHPDKEEKLLNMLSAEYYSMGDYAKCLTVAGRGLDIAYSRHKPRLAAELLLTMGQCQSDMGNLKSAVRSFDKSIETFKKIARKEPTWENCNNIVQAMSQKASTLLDECDYTAMTAMRQDYEHMLCKADSMQPGMEGCDDVYWASYYALYAIAYERLGDHARGSEMFAELMATRVSATPQGSTFVVPYLLLVHRNGEALRRIEEEEKSYLETGRDTVDYYYSNVLLMNKARALQALGRYKEAIEQGMRAYSLHDSLEHRMKEQNAAWMTETLGNKLLSKHIDMQTEKLRRSDRINMLIVSLLAIALVALTGIVYYNRIIRRKNRAASLLISDLTAYKEQLFRLMSERSVQSRKQPRQEPDAADREAFLRIEKAIAQDRLYLQPSLSKEDVAGRTGVPLQRLNQLFSDFSEMGFSNYVNDQRLLHAAKLLKEQPNYSVEAVAQDCGLPVRQTFYRLFRKKFGITPAEYRNNMLRQKASMKDGEEAAG